MVGTKKQDFLPIINICTQRNFFSKNPLMKKCQNFNFKVNFQCQKSTEFSQKKLRLRSNILAKRLGGRSLSRLMKNFGLGLLSDYYVDPCFQYSQVSIKRAARLTTYVCS
jgi:hypothetical protein